MVKRMTQLWTRHCIEFGCDMYAPGRNGRNLICLSNVYRVEIPPLSSYPKVPVRNSYFLFRWMRQFSFLHERSQHHRRPNRSNMVPVGNQVGINYMAERSYHACPQKYFSLG